jgi:hypothetical protein
MIDTDNIDSEKDLYKNRTVVLENGTKMYIRQDEQYGFWAIHNAKGKVADTLSGKYTDFNSALTKLNQYANEVIKNPIREVHRGFGIITDGNHNLIG